MPATSHSSPAVITTRDSSIEPARALGRAAVGFDLLLEAIDQAGEIVGVHRLMVRASSALGKSDAAAGRRSQPSQHWRAGRSVSVAPAAPSMIPRNPSRPSPLRQRLRRAGRRRAQRRGGAGGSGGLLRQLQVLQHERRGEARLVVVVGRARSAPGRAPGNRWSATSTAPRRSRPRRTAPDATGRASRPARTPRTRRSCVMPRIMLLQILAAWPAPASPQCTTRLPIASRIGLAALEGVLAARRTMKVSVAASAPPTPPDTGASSDGMPRRLGERVRLPRAESTSMVEESMNSVPCAAAPSTPPSQTRERRPCRPAASSRRPRRRRRIRGRVRRRRRRARAAASIVGRDEVEAVTSWPALTRLPAMGSAHVAEPDEADPRHASLRSLL